MKVIQYILILIFGACLTVSCSDEYEIASEPGMGNLGEMVFTLSVPGLSTYKTKALAEEDEHHIKTVDILVFKQDGASETFLYRTHGANISGAGKEKTFTATLKNSIASEQHRFVFLANLRNEVEDALSSITSATTKEDALAAITYMSDGRWNTTSSVDFTPLPMWGESAATHVVTNKLTTAQIGKIHLIRSVARVDVGVNFTGDTPSGLATDFLVSDVLVYNAMDRGAVAPLSGHLDASGVVSISTVPASASKTSAPIRFSHTPANFGFIREIYISESQLKGDDHEETCLVIGGYFNSSTQKTWYRVDFFRSRDNSSDLQERMPILRNHRYRINIVDVAGPGYITEDEAFKSKPMNMKTEILVWDETDFKDIIFDNHYMLGVTKSVYEFDFVARAETDTDNAIAIVTDYPTGWTLESVTDDDNNPITWVSLTPDNGPAGSTPCKIIAAGNGTIPQTFKLRLKAGRLSHTIIVKQGVQTADILYFATDGSLQVGQWGDNNINQESIAFFKFGSVIGFTNNGSLWSSDMSQIVFNPSKLSIHPTTGDIRDYGYSSTELPAIPAYSTIDWNNGIKNISVSDYHNASNVYAGKGDPCRLAGLTDLQIKMMSSSQINQYKSGWRLPTANENIDFMGAPVSWYNNLSNTSLSHNDCVFYARLGAVNGGWFSIPGNRNMTSNRRVINTNQSGFLPAAGSRNHTNGSGVTGGMGVSASFWSSTPTSATRVNNMFFNNTTAIPAFSNANPANGYVVRCVPTGETPSPAPSGLTISRDEYLFTYPEQTVSSGASNELTITTDASSWRVEKIIDDAGRDARNWITLNVVEGSVGASTVKILLTKNIHESTRTANIYIQAGTTVKVVKVTHEAYLNGGAADILYLSPDGTLQVGRWGTVTPNNMLFFKLGSVIGFTNDGTAWETDMSQVRYNPTNLVVNSATGEIRGYGSTNMLPGIPGYDESDWVSGIRNISENTYHSRANVQSKGKGDPCRLVGLTASQIRNMNEGDFNSYNSGWRLPATNENVDFVGAPSSWYDLTTRLELIESGAAYWKSKDGTDGGWFPISGERNSVTGRSAYNTDTKGYLPAMHMRDTNGNPSPVALGGFYWSSSVRSNIHGHNLSFYATGVIPHGGNGYAMGMGVRCIRK